MPLVVRITLAPVSRILRMRSRVMSASRLRMFSTKVGIPCAARVQLSAKPSTSWDSIADLPWHLRMLMAPTGYLVRPSARVLLTLITASTAILAKNFDSGPRILEDMEVVAAEMRLSYSMPPTGMVRCFLM